MDLGNDMSVSDTYVSRVIMEAYTEDVRYHMMCARRSCKVAVLSTHN